MYRALIVYLDDVIVYSRTFEEHLKKLEGVFQCLQRAGLKLQPVKCHFGKRVVQYLGHIVTSEGLKPDPRNIQAVKDFLYFKMCQQCVGFLVWQATTDGFCLLILR